MTRLAKIAKGLGALALLAALVCGIPFALWHFVGWPLPHRLPSWSGLGHDLNERGIPDRTLIDALAVAVWLTWAVLVASFVAEVPAAVRGQRARRLPLAGTFQPLTGRLVAALVVAMLALSPRPTHTSGAGLVDTRPAATAVLTDATAPAPSTPFRAATSAVLGGPARAVAGEHEPSAPVVSAPASAAHGGERTYVVRRGDTLWGIAERELGDPLRWSDIYRLNAGRPQPGGRVLSDPHWIDPGWTLVLPSLPGVVPVRPTPSPVAPEPVPTTTGPPSTAESPTHEPTHTAPSPTTVPPTTPARPASASGTSAPADHHEEGRGNAPSAPVRLPSGSIVGGSFALGILAALALARLRRRHAYRYHPPAPGRRFGPDPLRPTLRAITTALQPASDDGEAAAEEDAPPEPSLVIVPAMADEDPDHRERPDLIEVGTRGGVPVALSLGELAGAVLDGPDSDGVVRAWVTALLVRAGPMAAELCTTESAFERLVSGAGALAAAGDVPGVRVVADEDAVLRNLEAEALVRARQLDADDAPDALAYRRAYPWEPLPTVVALIEEVPAVDAERWRACCSDGARLGLGVLVLAGDGAGVTIDLDTDHVVTATRPVELEPQLLGVRLFSMRPEEAADVLATLIEVERRPASDEQFADADDDAEVEPWPEPVAMLTAPAPEAAAVPENDERGANEDDADAAPIGVRLFGPYEVAVGGEVVAKGLRGTGKELLAWYLLRPEGTSIEAAVEACWPDTERGQVHRTYWRAASSLRTKVGAVAVPPTTLIDKVGTVYRLDAEAIDCDLWRFQGALAEAVHTEDEDESRAALHRAVASYRGKFVDGEEYRWVEPVREDLHRRALDAHLRLAELEEQHGGIDAAEEVLRHATAMDRYAEEPYRRLMVLQANRGRLDAVAATWRVLERALAEIDVDPEPTTTRLYRSLTAPAGEHDRRTPPIRLSS
jgi:DNA-binding SARP family transcriptional activator